MKRLRRSEKQSSGRQRLADPTTRSPAAFSYHARRADQEDNTGRVLRREIILTKTKGFGRFWLQRFGLLFLLIAAAICVLSALSLSTHAQIEPLDGAPASSSFNTTSAAYQIEADKLLASSFMNRNKVTIDTGHISDQLLAAFPTLSSVSITLPLLGHRPIIYISQTLPALVYAAKNGDYVLSTNGKALSMTTTPASYNLPLVTDENSVDVVLGQQALSSTNISFIQTVVYELQAKGQTVDALTLTAASQELDVHIVGKSYFVKFNLADNDARQQAGTYLAVSEHLQSESITPSQYIDVRLDGRAYYL